MNLEGGHRQVSVDTPGAKSHCLESGNRKETGDVFGQG